jgi:uncharacterized protein YbbC (DUF1343 family)
MRPVVPRVQTGLDVLVGDRFAPIRGCRVGAICNPTSVDSRLRHLADLLHGSGDVELVALFGPEHGVRGDAQDMIGVASDVDSRTGVPTHSLYGSDEASLAPSPGQLDGLDVFVFDVQDVGSRYYTFAATMLYAMRVAAEVGIRFVVLDRPNPIGGDAIEGPSLRVGYTSFVGPHPGLPIRHGMTVGELARLFRAELRLDLELEVVACRGWSRSMLWADTGLPWVLPSPNMPTPETALLYPGGCLVEGTNLSEGRGTTRPFELWGAPWLDAYRLAESPGAIADGVFFRPCTFRPTFHKHAGGACAGVQPHVIDPDRFFPVATYTWLLGRALDQDRTRFSWRTEPYEFIGDRPAIDLLYGSPRERLALEAGASIEEIASAWVAEEAEFAGRRAASLLYDEAGPPRSTSAWLAKPRRSEIIA